MLRPCGKQDRGRIYNMFFFGLLGLTTQQLGSIHSHMMSQVVIWALGKTLFFSQVSFSFWKGVVFMTDSQKAKKLKKIRMSSRCFPFPCSNSGGFQGSQSLQESLERLLDPFGKHPHRFQRHIKRRRPSGKSDGRCGVYTHGGGWKMISVFNWVNF